MQIQELIKQCHETAREKGFWSTYYIIKELDRHNDIETPTIARKFHQEFIDLYECKAISLIANEVQECLEAHRNGDNDNMIEEIADVLIRVFDLCGALNIESQLEKKLVEKMEYNKTRSYKHNKKY